MTRDEWIEQVREGVKNLQGANLRNANLQDANLQDADLQGANLWGADLQRANLWDADLRDADLQGANLWGANLQRTNLQGADLRNANLWGADLRNANLPFFQIPQKGALTVWGKKGGVLVLMLVPDGIRRTACLVDRKCRAEAVQVISTETGQSVSVTDHVRTVYTPGEWVYPDSYDDDIRVACTHGIHFFLTREEAEAF